MYFTNSKHFQYVQYVIKEAFIYLVCSVGKIAQELVWVVSAWIWFSYILHWNCQVRALFSLWISLANYVVIADGKHLFLWTINIDLRLHKAEFIRGVLVTKKIRNLLIRCIAKNEEPMLDINLCNIKLHELCEFDKKIYF